MPTWPRSSPTLAEYLDWARERGCEIAHGVVVDGSRRVPRVEIVSEQGERTVVIGLGPADILMPHYVALHDDNLDLDSPFPKFRPPTPWAR